MQLHSSYLGTMVRYHQHPTTLHRDGFQNTQGERWVWQGGCTQEHAEEAVAWMPSFLFDMFNTAATASRCAWYSGTFSTTWGLQLCPKVPKVLFPCFQSWVQIVTLKGFGTCCRSCPVLMHSLHVKSHSWRFISLPRYGSQSKNPGKARASCSYEPEVQITSSWWERMDKWW